MNRQLSNCETETSYEYVRKDTCLYGKSSESYKDKHRVDNVWREFKKDLGFKAGEEILLYSIYLMLALKIAVLGIYWKFF